MKTKKALPRETAAAWFAFANAAAISAPHDDQRTAQAARSSDGAQVLDPVTVRGEAQKSLTAPPIEQAQREIRLTPGSASVVDPRTYETGRASTLADTLGYAPGTFVQPRFGAEEARISIRGSGIQRTFHGRGIVLLQDGVPLNLSDGGFDMQAVEPLGLQHIEVLRGANALQHGATTLGGAINFISPSGHSADSLRLRGEAGSNEYHRLFGATGGVAGDWDHAISLAHYGQQGFRRWAEQTSTRFFAKLRMAHRSGTRIALLCRRARQRLAVARNLDQGTARIRPAASQRRPRRGAPEARLPALAPDLPGARPGVARLRRRAALDRRVGARRAQQPSRRRCAAARRRHRRRPLSECRRRSRCPHRVKRPE